MDASVEDACQEYLTGIRWIWAYYTGKPVCFNWFYPYSLPPLWLNLGQMGLTLYQTGQDNRGNYSYIRIGWQSYVLAMSSMYSYTNSVGTESSVIFVDALHRNEISLYLK
jgi:hypothetical protein